MAPLCPARRRAHATAPLAAQNIRSKILQLHLRTSNEQRASLCLALPSSGETSSKCWRYNPKRAPSNVRYTLRAQTACNVARVKEEI